jgi:hypothetical protein
MTEQSHGPQILVGEQLNAVTFVLDYVQVHFNGPILTFFVPVHVQLLDQRLAFPGQDGRDALCGLIGAEVASVQADADTIELEFRDGRRLEARVGAEHRSGPEAAHFQGRPNTPLMVW